MIGKDATYRLRWNNISSELNLLSSFRELRENNSLFDVSLSCSDGWIRNSKPLKAHKVILSSYSPIFREMLCGHPNQSDPMIYLTKTSFDCASKLLDFMYNGEVNVFESELSRFMEMAEEFQIRGLKSRMDKNIVNKLIKNHPSKAKSNYGMKLEDELDDFTEQILKANNIKNEIRPILSRHQSIKIKSEARNIAVIQDENISENFATDIDMEETDSFKDHFKQDLSSDITKSEIRGADSSEYAKSSDIGRLEDLMIKLDKYSERAGGVKRFYSRCKLCGKETRTDEVKKHIRKQHAANLVE